MGTITQPIGALSTNTEPIFLTLLDLHCVRHDFLLYNGGVFGNYIVRIRTKYATPFMPTTGFEFLPTLRELVRTYQAFDAFSSAHIRRLGLTSPQFDVIATLGNTQGMSCRDIGQKTLMVKGTLTGVLDRLEQKGLISRISHPTDGRSTLVRLSPAGEDLFVQVFSAHLTHLEPVFAQLGPGPLETLRQHLELLRHSLEKQSAPPSD